VKRLAILNVVGLTDGLIGEQTPAIEAFRRAGAQATLSAAFPAVTCTAQADYLTGATASTHGIVGNGWFDRGLAEVHFWKQSNHLVEAPKVWERLKERHPGFSCAKLFWWFNMYSSADLAITPRPQYPADGRKVFDIYAWPYALRTEVKQSLGEFPFPAFWGPAAGVPSAQGPPEAASRWIADAALWVETRHRPHLSLVYLPHLDYSLQRLGPGHPSLGADLRRIDQVVGELIAAYRERDVHVLILSEYGIVPVRQPVHLNRHFREQGWLTVKQELGGELLDAGASRVFALADHQVAHIYVNDTGLQARVRTFLEQVPGVARVLGPEEQTRAGIRHRRAGDLIVLANPDAWFTYYYWLEDSHAPDFARTVDIHRKPGYDPVELFLDPAIRWPRLKVLWRLLQKRVGLRMLMDVIPLDASLVRGSHGVAPVDPADRPILLTNAPGLLREAEYPSTAVHDLVLHYYD
jgi:predicted AlkP superfamily pyrophosphatase or phosphodiesterase